MSYKAYVELLAGRLKEAPQLAEDLEQAASTASTSAQYADRSIGEHKAFATAAIKAIEVDLESARKLLAQVGVGELVPPKIKPSGVPKSATRADVSDAQSDLGTAVVDLKSVVKTEQERRKAEAVEIARLKAEQEAAAARRLLLLRIAVAAGLLVAILIVIAIFVL
jgi:hypothetical protein